MRLERGGTLDNVRLVEDPARRQTVHAEMAEKYGWADAFVALMSGDRSQALLLRIEIQTGP